MCLQLLLSKALSCHVQNFTIVSDIHEIYSTWSSFVSVVNHCLFSTVCGGGVCGYALFRHGGGWIHGEWRLGKFVTTLWYDCIMVSWCGCSLSKTLVGSCIAFFWTQLLFGGAVCCMQGMVTNMYIWMVFCGHNSFLARRFWHYSGWPQLPVGGSG